MRLATLVFVVIALRAFASPPDSTLDRLPRADSVLGRVRAITFIGNAKTVPHIILHELTFAQGDTVTNADLIESQHRVYNLGLFNSAEVYAAPDSTGGTVGVWVIVSERWYIWPQIILGVKDRDWAHMFDHGSKLFGGLGVMDYNVGGRREKLFVGGVLGYDPWASLEYSFLNLDEAGRYVFDASLGMSRTLNQSDTTYTGGLGFDEVRYNGSAQVTYRVTKRLNVTAHLEIQSLHLSNPSAKLTLNPSGSDFSPTVALFATYDSRDNAEYPMQGAYLWGSLAKTGAGTYVNYGRVAWDMRAYHHAAPWISLCIRAAGNLVYGGNIPVYNHMFLGLTERVRGDFSTKREGEDFAFGSFEARIPLWGPRVVVWSGAPGWVPSEFSSGLVGLYATLFADAGHVWFRNDRITDQQWTSGTGAGLNLLLPYGAALRVEYAVSGSISNGEWIVDLFASF